MRRRDEVIKAAREADCAIHDVEELERLYALAFKAGMERAAEIVDKLADGCATDRQQLAEVTERLEQVCIGAREELRKRWDAEAGYNAISERLYTAPVALMDTRTALSVCAFREEDFPALYALQGKRVRLVVEDEGEK